MRSDGRFTVGVVPAAAHGSRARLWRVLEAAYPVRFERREPGQWDGLDAAVLIGDAGLDAAPGIPSLVTGALCDAHAGAPVRFGTEAPAPLTGRSMVESASVGPPVAGEVALASSPAGTVWSASARGDLVFRSSVAPLELGPDERLKEHLRAGRFLALLPLVHLLRHVTGEATWAPPPLRASYIIDDPNLRWKGYGWLDYDAVHSHAERHGYHLGIAMIPLDAGLALSGAVHRFRTSRQLSVLMHGNNHLKREMADHENGEAAMALAAQALQRIAAFESRHQLSVGRVMVPPHGACSEEMMHALRRTGYDAIAYNTVPGGDQVQRALTGWGIADLHLGGGFPGMHRAKLDTPVDELALRAYLGQALLLYGHHTDLAGTLDPLAEAAARVAEVGDARWAPCAAITRGNVATRVEGDTMRVRLSSQRTQVDVAPGVGRLATELPWAARRAAWDRVRVGSVVAPLGEMVDVAPGEPVEVTLMASDAVDVTVVPAPARRPWPVLRRCMTEGRDRLLPLQGTVARRVRARR